MICTLASLLLLSSVQDSAVVAAPTPPPPPAPAEQAAAVETAEVEEPAEPEEPQGPTAAGPADWVQWERLAQSVLSPDGRWLAYGLRRGDGSSELRLRVLATDSTEVFEEGSRPTFSKDGHWLAFSRGYSEEEREKLEKKKKPALSAMGLFDLVRGESQEVESVGSFAFDASGRYLAMRRVGGEDSKHGADLVVRDLESGLDTLFGHVDDWSWSDEGSLLALVVSAADQVGNGLSVWNAAEGTLRVLDSAAADYAGLDWRKDAMDLAVMRSKTWEDDEDSSQVILAWRQVDQAKPKALRYDLHEDESQDGELRVVTDGGLEWSEDGRVLYFGLKPWEDKPAKLDEKPEDSTEGETEEAPEESSDESESKKKPKGDKETKADKDAPKPVKSLAERNQEPAGVEVWHAKDIDIVPLQKRMAPREERDSHLCALWIDEGRLVQLESDELSVQPLDGTRWALGEDETPYLEEQRFSATRRDLYRMDLATGDKQLILEGVKLRYSGDPSGRRIVFVRDDQIWLHELETGAQVNLTGELDVAFTNREMSTLTDEKPPYGVASWGPEGDTIYLYSRFDLWAFRCDGSSSERLTHGADQMLRHRLVQVSSDRDEERYLDLERGSYLAVYGDRTKQSGYAFLDRNGCVHKIMGDASLSGLSRAEDAQVYVHTQQRFDDSPDLFVSGADLDDGRQVSETNPFQADHLWGRSELVDYENASGEALQGALYYPAGYEEGKRYPMVVYIYEERSQDLHRYVVPSERSPYNTAVFTSAGYFVFQPDIVYRAQNPGLSAVDCVVPAVREVLSRGMVDEERVGLMGHSWGAYQTAFIVTQTDLFAAGVAGAPLTNMMSMSMSIYWNSGQTDAWIFHESQGRMDRPFWDDVDTYVRNSPIFSVDDLETPLLMTFGDKDGAVDWHQGIEFYNAARLVQSPLVMLVYPGENHGLRRKPNQLDYHKRVFDWFEHHLKDVPADDWISKGVPWRDQVEALKPKKD